MRLHTTAAAGAPSSSMLRTTQVWPAQLMSLTAARCEAVARSQTTPPRPCHGHCPLQIRGTAPPQVCRQPTELDRVGQRITLIVQVKATRALLCQSAAGWWRGCHRRNTTAPTPPGQMKARARGALTKACTLPCPAPCWMEGRQTTPCAWLSSYTLQQELQNNTPRGAVHHTLCINTQNASRQHHTGQRVCTCNCRDTSRHEHSQ